MSTQAVANGPIAFTDPNTGKFVSVPITVIKFTDGKIDVSDWPGYTTYGAQLEPWLKYLVQSGEVVPGVAAAPQPAMLIKAVIEGLPGNDVKVEFSNITVVDPKDPSKTTFDAKISEKQIYVGLKPDTIKSILGTETARGSQPGLVTILAADTPALPAANEYTLAGGDDTTKAKQSINQEGGGTAFTVEARSVSVEGNTIKATIADIDATANTFTLKTEYEKSITGLQIGDLPEKLAGAAGKEFVITVTLPSGGGSFGVPAVSVVTLRGGAEKAEAKRAAATIFTAA